MNPSRLAELRRHREQVRELLAWLDRQIAAEVESPPVETGMPVAIDPRSADALATDLSASLHAAERYEADPADAARNTRRGCLVAAALALLMFTLLLTAIYFIGYHDRGLFRSSPAPDRTAPPTTPARR